MKAGLVLAHSNKKIVSIARCQRWLGIREELWAMFQWFPDVTSRSLSTRLAKYFCFTLGRPVHCPEACLSGDALSSLQRRTRAGPTDSRTRTTGGMLGILITEVGERRKFAELSRATRHVRRGCSPLNPSCFERQVFANTERFPPAPVVPWDRINVIPIIGTG